MMITKIEELTNLKYEDITYTKKDMEDEYNAYVSINIVNKMLDNGLITLQEREDIIARIIDQFTPYLPQTSTQIT